MENRRRFKLLRSLAVLVFALAVFFAFQPVYGYADLPQKYIETFEWCANINTGDTFIMTSGYNTYTGEGINIIGWGYANESITTAFNSDHNDSKRLSYVKWSSEGVDPSGLKFESTKNKDEYYIRIADGQYLKNKLSDGQYHVVLTKLRDDATVWVYDSFESSFRASYTRAFLSIEDGVLDTEVGEHTQWRLYKKVPTKELKRLTIVINGQEIPLPVNNNASAERVGNIVLPCALNDLPADTELIFKAYPASYADTATCNTIKISDVNKPDKGLIVTVKHPGLWDTQQYYKLSIESHEHKPNIVEDELVLRTCSTPNKLLYKCKGYIWLSSNNPYGNYDNYAEYSPSVRYECGKILGEKALEEGGDGVSHQYVSFSRKGTCYESGIVNGQKCKLCGYINVNAGTWTGVEHTPVSDAEVPATCTSVGYTAGTHCSKCETTLSGRVQIAKLDHTYDTMAVTKEATCTETGTGTYTCTVCKETYEAVIPTKDHTPVEDAEVPASCFATGITAGTHCSACNAILSGHEVIQLASHTWDEGVVTEAPQCTEEGVRLYTCTVCQETKEEAISEMGHTPVEDVEIPATCHSVGYTAGTHCSVCEAVLSGHVETPLAEHTWNNGEAAPAAGCTTDGVMVYSCISVGCDATRRETIPANGHSREVISAVAATCTEDGHSEYIRCSECGTELTEKTVYSAIGHNYAGNVTKAPGCLEDGVRTYTCTNNGCNSSYTEVIASRGSHSVNKIVDAEAGCETYGTIRYQCEYCNYSYIEQTKPHGHAYTSKVTKEPTTTKNGVRTYTCSYDPGHTYTETIAMLPKPEEPKETPKEAPAETPAETPEPVETPKETPTETPAPEETPAETPEQVETPEVTPVITPVEPTQTETTVSENTEAAPESENAEVVDNGNTETATEISDEEVAKTADITDEEVPEAATVVNSQSYLWLILLVLLLAVAAVTGYIYVRMRKVGNNE